MRRREHEVDVVAVHERRREAAIDAPHRANAARLAARHALVQCVAHRIGLRARAVGADRGSRLKRIRQGTGLVAASSAALAAGVDHGRLRTARPGCRRGSATVDRPSATLVHRAAARILGAGSNRLIPAASFAALAPGRWILAQVGNHPASGSGQQGQPAPPAKKQYSLAPTPTAIAIHD